MGGKYDNVSMFSHIEKMFLQRLLSITLGKSAENVNICPIHNKEDKVKWKKLRMDKVHSSCIMITKKPMTCTAGTHIHENLK